MEKAALITKIGELINRCRDENEFSNICQDFVEGPNCKREVTEGHIESWKDCYDFLVNRIGIQNNGLSEFTIAFEYVDPGCYKRPDVIILSNNRVIILEFKQKNEILYDDVFQLGKYLSDIANFHYVTSKRNMMVDAFLVYTKDGEIENEEGFEINYLTPSNFSNRVVSLLQGEQPADIDLVNEWFESKWEPNKDMQDETLDMWEYGDTSAINNIRDSYVEGPRKCIEEIIENPKFQKNLIFLGGVPGAGKTMLGMQTVYKYAKYAKATRSNSRPIYISGNGPLINILQKTLSGTNDSGETYIKEISDFKTIMNTDSEKDYFLIVFDEAQRAWIQERDEVSEPEALIECAERIYNSSGKVTIIALIGDGQVIHRNERAGLQSWADAIRDHEDWNVFLPDKEEFYCYFPEIEDSNKRDLYLNISFRSGFTNISPLVESFLNLNAEGMKEELRKITVAGFPVRIFRDKGYIEKIVAYERKGDNDAHVGLTISSRVENLNPESIFPEGYENNRVKKNHAYAWYYSCHSLLNAASEFLMQGIEIDYPIVTFGGDYYIEDNNWKVNSEFTQTDEEILKNVYRVLLTRARKGLYIYIPENREYLLETYEFLKGVGIPELSEDYFEDRNLTQDDFSASRIVKCKKCGNEKRKITYLDKYDNNKIKSFYGCRNFPNCNG